MWSTAFLVSRSTSKDIIAVDLHGGYFIAGGFFGDVGVGRVVLRRGAHAVQVVLADEQGVRLPEHGHVEQFVELAFRRGAFAKEETVTFGLFCILSASPKPTAERQVAADDGVAAVEVGGLVEQVHGAAAAACAAGHFAVHLGHDRVGAHTARQGMPVLAVGGDDAVFGVRYGHHTGGDGFFANIQVQKTRGSWWLGTARRPFPRSAGSAPSWRSR